MRFLVCLFCIISHQCGRVENILMPEPPKDGEDFDAMVQLENQLKCLNDDRIIPVHNSRDSLKVNVRIVLKSVTYDMHGSTMSVHSWLALSWYDYHFEWDPATFKNIKTFHLSSDSIWTPDLSVFNRADYDAETSAYHPVDCIVYHTGNVVCIPPSRSDALCQPDLSRYPFDVQNCTLQLASWSVSGEHVDFVQMKPAVSVDDFVQQGEWRLDRILAEKVERNMSCCPDYSHPTLMYHFLITRNSGAHVCMIVVPALVLIMISLLTLCVSPEEKSRIGVISLNLIVHLLYLHYLAWVIPVSGLAAPLILVYTRDSYLLSALVLILTSVQRKLIRTKSNCPQWISKATSGIRSSRLGFYIFLFDENSKDLQNVDRNGHSFVKPVEKRNREDWLSFSRLLDKMFLLAYAAVYMGMFIVFVM